MHLQSAINTTFLSYWRRLRTRNGLPPYRRHLDPIEIPKHLLPHLFLTEISNVPFNVTFRLQGDFLVSKAGQSLRGKSLSADTFGRNWQSVEAIYRKVVETQKPVLSVERQSSIEGWLFVAEILHAPLIDDAGNVSHVVGAFDQIGHKNVRFLPEGHPETWEVLEQADIEAA